MEVINQEGSFELPTIKEVLEFMATNKVPQIGTDYFGHPIFYGYTRGVDKDTHKIYRQNPKV